MDFYSSDDNSSGSEEESDHLNKQSPLLVVHPMNGEPNTRGNNHSGMYHGLPHY